jgi:hypothetical protein
MATSTGVVIVPRNERIGTSVESHQVAGERLIVDRGSTSTADAPPVSAVVS